jgi:hypothetical protein
MPLEADATAWDFLSLVAWWNLYGLPSVLVAVALAVVIHQRLHRTTGSVSELPDSALAQPHLSRLVAVRMIALIHLGLALRAGVGLVQELLTLREQGIPQSFPVTGIIVPAISVAVNLAIGHGLWRLRSWGRRVAIPWDAVVAVITALIASWQWKYRASARIDQWPDYLVSDVLPWFLLAVMLMPGTRLVFAGSRSVPKGRWLSAVSLGALLLLIVVISTLVVDVADWGVRSWIAPVD